MKRLLKVFPVSRCHYYEQVKQLSYEWYLSPRHRTSINKAPLCFNFTGWHTHTWTDILMLLKSILFFFHIYRKSKLPIGCVSPHPPPLFPRFPGQPCQGGGKEQIMWGHSISLPLSISRLSLIVCVCIKTSLPMLSPHSQLSIALHRRKTERGEGHDQRRSLKHFFDLTVSPLSLILTFIFSSPPSSSC